MQDLAFHALLEVGMSIEMLIRLLGMVVSSASSMQAHDVWSPLHMLPRLDEENPPASIFN